MVGRYWVRGDDDVRALVEVVGVGSILTTNLILLAPLVLVLRRWPRPPVGTFTILFTTVAVSMTALDAFDRVELALAGVIGGVVADALVRSGRSVRSVAAVVPLVTWSSYFAVVEVRWGLEWSAELVGGSVTLAVVSGLLLVTLTEAGRIARAGTVGPPPRTLSPPR